MGEDDEPQDDFGDITPSRAFYAMLPIDNTSGLIDAGDVGDGKLFTADIETAYRAAFSLIDDHGGEAYVYRLVPIRRVYSPPKAIIENLVDGGVG